MSARLLLRLIVTAIAALACSAAHAQLFRAYLASDGSDANACTLAAPCRLLPAALAAVANGGEVWMLDSANYNTGPVTIGKSVTVLAIPGAVGSMVVLGGPAIVVNASSLEIALRNLVIVPFPGSGLANGIEVTGNSVITVESSLVAGILGYGIVLDAGSARVVNSTMRNIQSYAIRVNDTASAYVSGSRILRSGGGVGAISGAGTTINVRVSDTLIGDCGTNGIEAVSASAPSVVNFVLTGSVIQGCNQGINVQALDGTATVSVNASSITGNPAAGFFQQSTGGTGTIRSFGNNHFDMNGPNTGALTSAALQ